MATVTTLGGDVYVVMRPEEIAKFMRDRGGPVMRHLIVQGEKVKQEAVRIAPRITGNMANHIVKRVVTQGGEPAVLVGIDSSVVPYAYWVHEGAPPHPIWPKDREKGRLVFFSKKLGKVIVMRPGQPVKHPGNKPNRFLIRALSALRG